MGRAPGPDDAAPAGATAKPDGRGAKGQRQFSSEYEAKLAAMRAREEPPPYPSSPSLQGHPAASDAQYTSTSTSDTIPAVPGLGQAKGQGSPAVIREQCPYASTDGRRFVGQSADLEELIAAFKVKRTMECADACERSETSCSGFFVRWKYGFKRCYLVSTTDIPVTPNSKWAFFRRACGSGHSKIAQDLEIHASTEAVGPKDGPSM